MSLFDLLLATKFSIGPVGPMSEGDTEGKIDAAAKNGSLDVLNLLPGPWDEVKAKGRHEQAELLHQVGQLFQTGTDVFQFARWQQEHGDAGLSSNIIVPMILGVGVGTSREFEVKSRVILAHPDDCERIARTHVRKEGNFEAVLYDSIIATTDDDHWRRQRKHLSETFMPLSSLASILPVSLARAKLCASKLLDTVKENGEAVDMSDFLLHEAQAQLQLALLGASEELMESTNEDIRSTFMGDLDKGKVGALGDAMKALMKVAETDQSLALPSDDKPVRGPLSRAVQTSGMAAQTNYGNMLLILFAGHDTTGHTMTWLLFEVARHPEIQRSLLKEVDEFFAELGDRDPTYRDLGKLPLLDRCITETLRMWPAVASGTYRKLLFDDTVIGPNGKNVTLPKGTFVNIVNWSRHRNPDLWGPDANQFNPYRDFKPQEMASVARPGSAMNIQSERFSPFAHAPRGCLGRNFAQMEMRLILPYLFKQFEFSLGSAYERLAGVELGATPGLNEFRGINRATMGPMDLERSQATTLGERHLYALKLNARPRA